MTSRIERVRHGVRIGISAFVLLLLSTIVLGWLWTSQHQVPPLRTASRIVLSLAGAAGIFALARIWRPEALRGSGRP
jgi:tellurite resistance protein TehA-like permease